MTMQIYVGTYAKYAAGNLAGGWLDVEDYANYDEFLDACKALHSGEHDPEFMFQDHEGCADYVSEGHLDPELWKYVALLETSHMDQEAWEAGRALGIPLDKIEDAYYGAHDSDVGFAQEWADSIESVDWDATWPHNHIDWEMAAMDLMQGFIEENGHYFSATSW